MSEYGPMYDAIIASAPIGYWPLTSVTDVVAGVAGTLVKSPKFTGRPLNEDTRNSLNTSAPDGAMRIAQDQYAALTSLEMCFIIAGSSSDYGRGIIGLHQPSSGTTARVILVTRVSDSAVVFYSKDNSATLTGHTYATLSDRPHHLYIEYSVDANATAIYIDGIFVLQYAGNQLANTIAGRYITAGGYYYDGDMLGGSHVSDLALYSRRLTTEELATRVALVGDPVPVHQSAELRVTGVRWIAGSTTQPPQRDDYGYIEGTVKNSGVSVPDQRVACFDNSHNLIDEVKSGPDGAYRFDNLPRLNSDTYVVMARDSNGLLSPATADNRIPEAYS